MEQNNEPVQNQIPEKKKMPISIPAAIITAGVLIALAVVLSSGTPFESKKAVGQQVRKVPVETPLKTVELRASDPIRGDSTKATFVIVEYSDSDCPFCQRFHQTMKTLVDKYNGDVAWVYRYFPLSIHPNAYNEALALACVKENAGNDAFWNYLDSVIDITLTPEKSAGILTSLAKEQGVDALSFGKCIANKTAAATIALDAAEAPTLGAQGTPFSIIINTKTKEQRVIPGALPLNEIEAMLKEMK